MAMKKENVDLRAKNITFTIQNELYKAIRFYHSKMTVDAILQGDDSEGIKNFPFAHLPKDIKKKIKPN